jgi:hypothetical protein
MSNLMSSFGQQVDCEYEGERYSVRDNGAIYRHARPGKRSRAADEQWTFGKPNLTTGYLELASVRIHRIIATAFHGVPPTRQHVVDHIDTNRHNNRPENLRWVTRLENVLLNPITAKRIAFVYGSVEAFLADPKMPPINGALDKNFEWMRTVSPEEARISHERLMRWANSDNLPSGGTLGEWLFNRTLQTNVQPEEHKESAPAHVVSKTPGAVQRKWQVPSHFPACPPSDAASPLEAYAANLLPGTVFAENDFNKSVVIRAAFSPDRGTLWVMCEFAEDSIKPWSLAKVTFEDGLFVHTSDGTFFEKEGAEKYFTLGQGLEWTGGEVFDDFC